MNYFAHGFRFVDRPYFLAGTAVPDWLSVLDRKSRARECLARPFINDTDGFLAEVALGICQHHEDDGWFHRSEVFQVLQAEVTLELREVLPDDRGFRSSFVAHVLIEMLLDATIIQRSGDLIERYYESLLSVDFGRVQAAVNRMSTSPTAGIPLLVPDFCAERFLNDYGEDATLLRRLNHVMRRVKLADLPQQLTSKIASTRNRVERSASELLFRIELPQAN